MGERFEERINDYLSRPEFDGSGKGPDNPPPDGESPLPRDDSVLMVACTPLCSSFAAAISRITLAVIAFETAHSEDEKRV